MSEQMAQLFQGGDALALAKGQSLFETGAAVRSMYFVVQGAVDLVRYTQSGHRMILFRANDGQVLAEASAYSNHYHCDAIAKEPSNLVSISISNFLARLNDDRAAMDLWTSTLAHQLQAARMNAEIRALRTVSERLSAWLAIHSALPPKGHWQDLAETLGVSKEALYREIAKRRSEALT